MLSLIIASVGFLAAHLPARMPPPEPRLQLASMTLTGVGSAAVDVAPTSCGDGTLDLSTGCAIAVAVIF